MMTTVIISSMSVKPLARCLDMVPLFLRPTIGGGSRPANPNPTTGGFSGVNG